MSFEIFLQAFERGDRAERDSSEVRRLLAAATRSAEPERRFAHIGLSDGEADVYGVPQDGEPLSGLMFNHVAGANDAWDLVFAVATAADLVILPVGCPILLVGEHQRQHLPPELAGGPVEAVRSGREVREVIARS